MWKLIPVEVEGVFSPVLTGIPGWGYPPPYGLDPVGQFPAKAHRAECERDDFGTIVTEVTTITTRKRYRVEGGV
jgi:hypothetical protein